MLASLPLGIFVMSRSPCAHHDWLSPKAARIVSATAIEPCTSKLRANSSRCNARLERDRTSILSTKAEHHSVACIRAISCTAVKLMPSARVRLSDCLAACEAAAAAALDRVLVQRAGMRSRGTLTATASWLNPCRLTDEAQRARPRGDGRRRERSQNQ